VLADQLRQRILDGELTVGTMLPPERSLSEQSGFSRTVVREALRILEIEGLVRVRPGRGGGTEIQRPQISSLANTLEIYVRGDHIRFLDVLEIRANLEPACARLAAERRTPEELRALTKVTDEMDRRKLDVPSHLSANTSWHVLIAQMSHNELLGAFMGAIATAVRAATDVDPFRDPKNIDGTLRAHRKILEAIRDRDGKAAETAMLRHVQAYRELAQAHELNQDLPISEHKEEQ
jgi:GntR family transcriptional regulator, transcriptional repressor for pyruvate dehydrogenase complex